ncbi:MAG: caspase domain-containing protein [Bryobacteraceae bacterium]
MQRNDNAGIRVLKLTATAMVFIGSMLPQNTPARKPKPSTPTTAPGKPAAASKPAPTADDAAVASKGFSRMAVTPEVKQQFEGEQSRYAILVAPNYAGSDLNPLRFTVADTLELKGELERQGYVTRLISPGEATSESIRNALASARQLLDGKPQSTFLFAFSGHGFQMKDPSGQDRNYLATLGVTRDRLVQEALPLNEVEKLMSESGARRKVILIDACRNDPNAKGADGARSFAQLQESEGTTILLSTRPGGFSYEDRELGHGIFTYYLLEGLRGKAAGKDGFVTFYDLEKYVETSVVSRAMKQDLVQRPFALGEHYGDFLIATAAPPKSGDIAPLPAASQQIDSNTAILWQIIRQGGIAQSFYAFAQGPKLTLVNNKTLAPFVELTETATNDLEPGYRHFKGTASGQVVELAVQMQGEAVTSAKGRMGTPCPGSSACSNPEEVKLMLLPGEKLKGEAVRDKAGKAKNTLDSVSGGIGLFSRGRASRTTEAGGAAASMTQASINNQNEILRFRWESFDLTSKVPAVAH